jgi:hypothetical protein
MQTQDFQQANFHEKEQYLTNAQLRQSDFYLFVTLFGLFLGVSLVLRMILLG